MKNSFTRIIYMEALFFSGDRRFSDDKFLGYYYERGFPKEAWIDNIVSLKNRLFIEKYTYYKEQDNLYLKTYFGELEATGRNKYEYKEKGNITFVILPQKLCKQFDKGTKCDMNIIPTLKQGAIP